MAPCRQGGRRRLSRKVGLVLTGAFARPTQSPSDIEVSKTVRPRWEALRQAAPSMRHELRLPTQRSMMWGVMNASPASADDDEALLREFAIVRSVFFPRWDRSKVWRVEARNRAEYTREHGYCDLENKTILVDPVIAGGDRARLRALLIHEVCHAVASPAHGKRFMARLTKAADRARAVGMDDLSGRLEHEIRLLKENLAIRFYPSAIYNQVEDVVRDCGGDIAYDDLARHIAGQYGLTIEELERRCRRLREVYREAVCGTPGDEMG